MLPSFLVMPDRVGLSHSELNESDLGEGFEYKVVLPNGKECGSDLHGIQSQTLFNNGITEIGGILHSCGGKYINGSYSGNWYSFAGVWVWLTRYFLFVPMHILCTGQCHTLDLSKEQLVWEQIAGHHKRYVQGGQKGVCTVNKVMIIFES